MNVEQAQIEVEEEILNDIQYKIEELGIQDLIYLVETQGSYAKGTDLPKGGSDIDIFIIFNTDVPLKEREKYGLEIGEFALRFYGSDIKDATSKYVEAFFPYEGYEMEVQIVQTRDLTLKQIQDKKVDGKPITIGMERTPHQTRFMNKHLTPEMKEEVRKLKQFMKDNGLYDSSMKSQGFSGYAIECLIYYLMNFDNVIEFFSKFKVGSRLGMGVGNKDNIFHLMDPIDPNRDLISAFSPVKIARTIVTCEHYVTNKVGLSQSNLIELPSVTITYTTTEKNEDTLAGQIRKTQKSMITQLKRHGFIIPVKQVGIVKDFIVDIARVSSDKIGNQVSITFGIENLLIPPTYKDKGVPLNMKDAIKNYREANPNREFVEENGKLKAIKGRKYRHLTTALDYLVFEIQQSGVTKDILNNYTITEEKSKFENLI